MSLTDRATMLLESGRPQLALEVLEDHLVQQPNDAEAYALMAWAYSDLDQYKKGIEAADQAIGLDAEDYYGYFMKGCLLHEMQEWGKAQKVIQEALRLEPKDADLYARSADIYISESEWQKALDKSDAGIELNPRHFGCWIAQSRALARLRRFEEAEHPTDTAQQLKPEHQEGFISRGLIAQLQGESLAARGFFIEALRIEPRDTEAREGYLQSLRADHFFFFWPIHLGHKIATMPPKRAKFLLRVLLRGGLVVAILAGVNLLSVVLFIPAVLAIFLAGVPLYFLALNWFDLALLLTPEGRAVMDDDERNRVRWFLASMAATGICLLIAASIKWQFSIAALAVLFGQMPISSIFYCRTSSMAKLMVGVSLLCNGLALAGLALELAQPVDGIGVGLQICMASVVLSLLGGWAGLLLAPKVD